MDYEYCHKKCRLGREKSDELLNKNNSVYDAAMDFLRFADTCFKTCPFADKHANATKNKNDS